MIGASGTVLKRASVIPFLMSVLPSRIDRDVFALEDDLDVGERRAAVETRYTGPSRGLERRGVCAVAVPMSDPSGQPAGLASNTRQACFLDRREPGGQTLGNVRSTFAVFAWPGCGGELAQERAQAACVALPEGMDRVHLSVVVRQSIQERLTIETDQMPLLPELGEDAPRVTGDMLRAGVESIGLGDLDRTQLARPRIQRSEDATVKGLPMRQIVVARKRLVDQGAESETHDVGLSLRELCGIAHLEVVAQGTRARIDIRILRHQKRREAIGRRQSRDAGAQALGQAAGAPRHLSHRPPSGQKAPGARGSSEDPRHATDHQRSPRPVYGSL